MIDLEMTVVRNDKILSAAVGDESVLMSLESGTYYALKATSLAIWEHLKEPVRVSDLCDLLADIYQAPLETVKTDTLEFLSLLETQKMIEAQPAATI